MRDVKAREIGHQFCKESGGGLCWAARPFQAGDKADAVREPALTADLKHKVQT